MIDFCVKNPVKVAVGVLVVALFGSIALWRMPKQLTPEVRIPTISVFVRWPGASPREVEHEVVQKLEEQLKDVKGMTRMSSWSNHSSGVVTMQFAVGNDMSESLLEVNSRLHQVRDFPEEAWEPVISSANLSDQPVCWFVLSPRVPTRDELEEFIRTHPHLADVCRPLLKAHKWDLLLLRLKELSAKHPELRELGGDTEVSKLRQFVEDHIKSRFDRVPGVADAFLLGGQEREMQVVVNSASLAGRKLTIDELRSALRRKNKDTSGGELLDGNRTSLVRTVSQYSTPEQIRNTIIAKRGGKSVYVRDVAKVKLGYKRPNDSYRRGGSELIGIGIRAETGANILDVVARLRKITAELNQGQLQQRGLQLTEVWSDADYIDSAVGMVNQNILIGGFLTIAVLLIFLRSAKSTLVIALAVPASIIGTFLILNGLGRSLNVVSLAGLAFAVGMIVDNSVVVLENIYRHYEQGESPFVAAVRGTREVWGAVLASTLTTLAVFIPVLFNDEQAGQLFRDIALAISAAVGLSLIIAITVIPAAAARVLSPQEDSDSNLDTKTTQRAAGPARRFVRSIVGINRRLQNSVPLRLAVVVGFISGSVLLITVLFPHVEYLPHGNKNRIHCRLYPPPGKSLAYKKDISESLFQRLRGNWEIDPASPEVGDADGPLLKDLLVRAEPGSIMAQVQAENPKDIRKLIPILRSVGREYPGMHVSAYQLSLFPGSSRKIDLELTGNDMQSLVPLAIRVQDEIKRAIPGAQTSASPDLSIASPEVHVRPQSERGADYKIDETQLGYAVDALVDGAYVTDYSIGGEKIDLRIIDDANAGDVQELKSMPVATGSGQIVSLSGLANVKAGAGPRTIRRIERRRAITVEVRPPPDVSLGEAIALLENQVIRPMRDSGGLAEGQEAHLGGTADRLLEAWLAMRFNLILALAITYLLMAALFESWIYPFVIILTVPLAAVGGFAGLWIVNRFVEQPLDIITMLGFVLLIGTSINNAILIVHQSLNHMRDHEMTPRQAVLESVRTRIRPIFMTTGTTIMGLFPLVVMSGPGSELYRGLGSVVLGGLAVSTLLTLILVPTLFSLMMDAKVWLRSATSHRRRMVDQVRKSAPSPAPSPVGEVSGTTSPGR